MPMSLDSSSPRPRSLPEPDVFENRRRRREKRLMHLRPRPSLFPPPIRSSTLSTSKSASDFTSYSPPALPDGEEGGNFYPHLRTSRFVRNGPYALTGRSQIGTETKAAPPLSDSGSIPSSSRYKADPTEDQFDGDYIGSYLTKQELEKSAGGVSWTCVTRETNLRDVNSAVLPPVKGSSRDYGPARRELRRSTRYEKGNRGHANSAISSNDYGPPSRYARRLPSHDKRSRGPADSAISSNDNDTPSREARRLSSFEKGSSCQRYLSDMPAVMEHDSMVPYHPEAPINDGVASNELPMNPDQISSCTADCRGDNSYKANEDGGSCNNINLNEGEESGCEAVTTEYSNGTTDHGEEETDKEGHPFRTMETTLTLLQGAPLSTDSDLCRGADYPAIVPFEKGERAIVPFEMSIAFERVEDQAIIPVSPVEKTNEKDNVIEHSQRYRFMDVSAEDDTSACTQISTARETITYDKCSGPYSPRHSRWSKAPQVEGQLRPPFLPNRTRQDDLSQMCDDLMSETLSGMFGPPWTAETLAVVLQYNQGSLRDSVKMVLLHGSGSPEDLISRIQVGTKLTEQLSENEPFMKKKSSVMNDEDHPQQENNYVATTYCDADEIKHGQRNNDAACIGFPSFQSCTSSMIQIAETDGPETPKKRLDQLCAGQRQMKPTINKKNYSTQSGISMNCRESAHTDSKKKWVEELHTKQGLIGSDCNHLTNNFQPECIFDGTRKGPLNEKSPTRISFVDNNTLHGHKQGKPEELCLPWIKNQQPEVIERHSCFDIKGSHPKERFPHSPVTVNHVKPQQSVILTSCRPCRHEVERYNEPVGWRSKLKACSLLRIGLRGDKFESAEADRGTACTSFPFVKCSSVPVSQDDWTTSVSQGGESEDRGLLGDSDITSSDEELALWSESLIFDF